MQAMREMQRMRFRVRIVNVLSGVRQQRERERDTQNAFTSTDESGENVQMNLEKMKQNECLNEGYCCKFV